MHHSINFSSEHFVIHPLAEGVLAAIAVNGGSAICNAGLIDLGGLIVVFDTFLTPQAARDLQLLAAEKFGGTPQIVINSHYHNDHTWGNQVFASSAPIISSVRTRQLMATEGLEELQSFSMNAAKRLESLQKQFDNSVDEQEKQELLLWIGEYRGAVEALPTLKISLPGITFDRHLEIHGEKQAAQLITFEGAHTGSDTVLYLPQAGIIFMSDLLFVGFHPYLADGDPLQLLQALRELSQLNASCFVPGHGPVGTIEDVKLLMAYIEHCSETARSLVETGTITEARINQVEIPPLFRHWHLAQLYRANLGFLCSRLTQEISP